MPTGQNRDQFIAKFAQHTILFLRTNSHLNDRSSMLNAEHITNVYTQRNILSLI